MQEFHINEEYLTDVTQYGHLPIYPKIENPNPEQLLEILKRDTSKSIEFQRQVDHPMFAELRNRLESLGYIKCNRNWSNGDVVLKPFVLNEMLFDKDARFPCAVALGVQAITLKKRQKL